MVNQDFTLGTDADGYSNWTASITPRRNKARSEYTIKVRAQLALHSALTACHLNNKLLTFLRQSQELKSAWRRALLCRREALKARVTR